MTSIADLDVRDEKYRSELEPTIGIKAKILKLTPIGDFEAIKLDNTPLRTVKI